MTRVDGEIKIKNSFFCIGSLCFFEKKTDYLDICWAFVFGLSRRQSRYCVAALSNFPIICLWTLHATLITTNWGLLKRAFIYHWILLFSWTCRVFCLCRVRRAFIYLAGWTKQKVYLFWCVNCFCAKFFGNVVHDSRVWWSSRFQPVLIRA